MILTSNRLEKKEVKNAKLILNSNFRQICLQQTQYHIINHQNFLLLTPHLRHRNLRYSKNS